MTTYSAVSLDGLGDEVTKLVAEHIDDTREEVKKHVQKAGKAGSKALKQASPKLTGVYASGWTYKTQDEGMDSFSVLIHNTTKPSLSHLLEFGHGLVWMGHPTGRTVPPYPHMDEGYDAGAKALMG